MSRVFLLDGMVEVSADTPVLRADDLGVVRGEAVFETLRIVEGRPCYLDEHLERFAQSATRLEIALPEGFAALATLASDGVADAGLRLTTTKGGLGFAVVFDIAPETVAGRAGISVVTLPLGISAAFRRTAPWLLGGVKSTSYAINMATQREARARGADDAIWVSTDGFVLEAPTSTVVALVGGDLVTPPVDTGILPGTTLRACRRLASIVDAPLRVEDVEQLALLSSVRGIAPVTALDGRTLKTTAMRELQQSFEASLTAR